LDFITKIRNKNPNKIFSVVLIILMFSLTILSPLTLNTSALQVERGLENVNKNSSEPPLEPNELKINADDELYKLGQWDENYGEQYYLCVDGDYLYTASHFDGIMKYDITQPDNPVLLGAFGKDKPNYGDFIVKNNIMFKQGYDNGFEILNVSNINQVEELAFLEGNFTHRRPSISGDLLITSNDNVVFLIYDISNLLSPSLIQTFDLSNSTDYIHSFAVKDNNLFLFDDASYLRIYNLTNPFSPELITIFNTTFLYYYNYEIQFNDYYLYNHLSNAGILFINITDVHNPKNLAFMNQTTEGFSLNGCTTYQNMLYIFSNADLLIYNITDLKNRIYIGSVYLYGHQISFDQVGEHLFVIEYLNELRVFNLSDSTDPQLVFQFEYGGYSYDVTVSGNVAVIANNMNGVLIFDISNKSNPIEVHRIPIFRAIKVLIQDNLLFIISNYQTIMIYDITDIEFPVNKGQYTADIFWKSYIDFIVDGNYLTLLNREGGIEIIDVSNPYLPFKVDEHHFDYFTCEDLLLDGSLLYLLGIGTIGDIVIFDVSNYLNSEIIKILSISNLDGKEMFIDGKVLYMLGYSHITEKDYLYYYKIKRNNVYQLDGYYEIGNLSPEDLIVAGNYIYLASYDYGIVVFRKSTFNIFEIYTPFTNNETSHEFTFNDGYIYLAAGYDGFIIYEALTATSSLRMLFIVLGVVLGITVIVVAVLLFMRRRRRKELSKS